MSQNVPSKTYKLLFKDIISPLLSQIFKRFPNYCLRNRNIPYEIGKKFEEYKGKVNKFMDNPKLDRHKLASCICGAIIETQPISYISNNQSPQRANEILGLYVGLGVIKDFMMFDLINTLSGFEEKQKLNVYLKKNFFIFLPALDNNICDTQEYEQNLFNALLWTHHKCEIIGKDCFHYDIWAYAKIFYHIESYNKSGLNELWNAYLENVHT